MDALHRERYGIDIFVSWPLLPGLQFQGLYSNGSHAMMNNKKRMGLAHALFVWRPAIDFSALYTATGKNRPPIFACKMARTNEAYSFCLRNNA
jgi:hypothetical protein